MDATQLWDTTMDPDVRTLLQINLDNAMEADAVFEQLMGEEVEPRRRFIEENAVYVKNLDI
jgi:DNA gyrase subunit B